MKVEKQKKWIGYIECMAAFAMSLLSHVPNFFKFQVKLVNISVENHGSIAINETIECWISELDYVTNTSEWEVFNIVSHVIIRIFPTILITVLNLAMVYRIRKIFSTRKRLFGPKKVPTSSKVEQNGKFLTLPTVSENLERRRSSSNSSDILRKIVRKWYAN